MDILSSMGNAHQLYQRIEKLEKALRDIMKHQEVLYENNTGWYFILKNSVVYNIAKKALEEI